MSVVVSDDPFCNDYCYGTTYVRSFMIGGSDARECHYT